MRKIKSGRRKPKRTGSGAILGSRLSFDSLEPRNLLAAVTPVSIALQDFDSVPAAAATEVHCKITEENPCSVDRDDDAIIFSFDHEVEPSSNDDDSRPPPLRVNEFDGPSVDNPASESPQDSPDVQNYPQEIRESAAGARVSAILAPAETSRLIDRTSLQPISILPATEIRSTIATDVFLNEVNDSVYFLSKPIQSAAHDPIFRSGLIASHRTFSVIDVDLALESTTHARNTQL